MDAAGLNGVDSEAWLADTINRIADHPAYRIAELLPWNYRPAGDAPLAGRFHQDQTDKLITVGQRLRFARQFGTSNNPGVIRLGPKTRTGWRATSQTRTLD